VAEPSLYLFDGFNLLHAGGFGSPEELRDLLASWVAGKGVRGVLVFDGHGADESHGPLEVRWAPDADTMIERLAAEYRSGEQVAEVRKLSSRAFLDELAPPTHTDRSRGDLRDKLDAETLARLERLRRGE
jgi:predicted RNA-binding protein with PIN domain